MQVQVGCRRRGEGGTHPSWLREAKSLSQPEAKSGLARVRLPSLPQALVGAATGYSGGFPRTKRRERRRPTTAAMAASCGLATHGLACTKEVAGATTALSSGYDCREASPETWGVTGEGLEGKSVTSLLSDREGERDG